MGLHDLVWSRSAYEDWAFSGRCRATWKDGQDRLKNIGRRSILERFEAISYVIRGNPVIIGINIGIPSVTRNTQRSQIGMRPIWKEVLLQEEIFQCIATLYLIGKVLLGKVS